MKLRTQSCEQFFLVIHCTAFYDQGLKQRKMARARILRAAQDDNLKGQEIFLMAGQ